MTKFCPECGTKQKVEDARFCANCGFNFSTLEKEQKVTVNISSDDDSENTNIPNSSDTSLSSNSTDSGASGTSSSSGASSSSVGSGTIVGSGTSGVSVASSSAKSNNNTSQKSSPQKQVKISNNDGFLSKLSFSKCFLGLVAVLVILLILGMLINATQTEPYSDDGLTSFMEKSDYYDLNDFLEDTRSDANVSYDYLNYNSSYSSDG